MLCEWRAAARAADYLVMNRGYHSLTDPHVDQQMAELNETVASLASLMRGTHLHPLRRRVVYRGTHGSQHNCLAR